MPTLFAASKKTLTITFMPMLILAAAALVANFGGITPKATAADINVSATVQSNAAITNVCGTSGTTGTLNLGSIAATGIGSGDCVITFGASNAPSTLKAQSSTNGAALLSGGFIAKTVAACGELSAKEVGIRAATGTDTTIPAAFNCSGSDYAQVPSASASNICVAAASGNNKTCTITIAANADSVNAGSVSGTLEVTV